MDDKVDEFGKKLVQQVRDEAILSLELLKNPYLKSHQELGLNKFDRKSVEGILDKVIPDIVDTTLFYLLHAIDGGDIKLIYVTDDGRNCDLEQDGMWELAGWLSGEEGWVDRYSKVGA